MEPPNKKRKSKKRRRNWSSELGFLFFAVLFLTLIERNPIVYADFEETHEKLEFPNAVTSNISILLANITGKYQLLFLYCSMRKKFVHFSMLLVCPLIKQIPEWNDL